MTLLTKLQDEVAERLADFHGAVSIRSLAPTSVGAVLMQGYDPATGARGDAVRVTAHGHRTDPGPWLAAEVPACSGCGGEVDPTSPPQLREGLCVECRGALAISGGREAIEALAARGAVALLPRPALVPAYDVEGPCARHAPLGNPECPECVMDPADAPGAGDDRGARLG